MTPKIYQGDPRLIIGPDGSRLQFIGGQPLMDRGLENAALISLFTSPGWCGNAFMKSPIGSDFETECNKPITLSQLSRIREAAERALDNPMFGTVVVTVTNPTGLRLVVSVRIHPPGSNPIELSVSKNGGNWVSQGHDPAYRKITGSQWEAPLLFEDNQIITDDNDAPLRY